MKELKTHFNVSCGDHAFSMKQRIDRKFGIKSLPCAVQLCLSNSSAHEALACIKQVLVKAITFRFNQLNSVWMLQQVEQIIYISNHSNIGQNQCRDLIICAFNTVQKKRLHFLFESSIKYRLSCLNMGAINAIQVDQIKPRSNQSSARPIMIHNIPYVPIQSIQQSSTDWINWMQQN